MAAKCLMCGTDLDEALVCGGCARKLKYMGVDLDVAEEKLLELEVRDRIQRNGKK